ncbi:FixH family protein [Hoeflea sp. WL0058]|uniref:FixH family protein n=1 Tax=Flavimaribacter sediminis TaxID=2865987 RepID=A0AAE2ZGB0_9HYPH|nr:FixH family protein [Flavimaribacter sediminis]MBW8636034.1 FixH family protein [Flavimaribacter sediminis]
MSLFNSIFRPAEFTGRHMLGIIVAFFAVVIGVNLTMAYFASHSWSGLIVHNTYVASQHFDEDVEATKALHKRGWVSDLDVDGETIVYTLDDASGAPIEADEVVVLFQRPASELQDREVRLLPSSRGRFESQSAIATGQWLARISVKDGDSVLFSETRRFIIRNPGADK